MFNRVTLPVTWLSETSFPFFFHTTSGVGRPVTVHTNVTSLPSSAVRFGEIQMIFGGTENKEKVWEYEQMYASKEELKCF